MYHILLISQIFVDLSHEQDVAIIVWVVRKLRRDKGPITVSNKVVKN